MGMIAFLVMREPDMGTTLVLVAIGVTIFFVAGAHLIQFLGSMVMGGFVFYLLMFTASYRKSRLTRLPRPGERSAGRGLPHLPIADGDRVRAAVRAGPGRGPAEVRLAAGAVHRHDFRRAGRRSGASSARWWCWALFALLVLRGTRAALRARDSYGTLLAAGITAWIGVQALINIGAVSRAIPFTGITLPFISYGGTSLAVTLAAMGLLLNISRYQAPRRAPTLAVSRAAAARRRGAGGVAGAIACGRVTASAARAGPEETGPWSST